MHPAADHRIQYMRANFCEGLRVVIDGKPAEYDALIRDNDPNEEGILICAPKRTETIYGEVRIAQKAKLDMNTREVEWLPSRKAIKIFYQQKIERSRLQENHENEIQVQCLLSRRPHPNVMPIEAVLRDSEKLYIVMPFAEGGELFEWVADNEEFIDETTLKKMFRGMVEGIQFIHEHGICHRDVSLENFVLENPESLRPVLIDFGLSYRLQNDEDGMWLPIPFTEPFGKANYISPEFYLISQMYRTNKRTYHYDGIAQDLWGLAVCLFMMRFRRRPWKIPYYRGDPNYHQIVYSSDFRGWLIRRGLLFNEEQRVYANDNFEISEDLVDLMQLMFQQEPHDRYSTSRILEHRWMNS